MKGRTDVRMIWPEPIFLTHGVPPHARESFALKANEPGFFNNLLDTSVNGTNAGGAEHFSL